MMIDNLLHGIWAVQEMWGAAPLLQVSWEECGSQKQSCKVNWISGTRAALKRVWLHIISRSNVFNS